MNHAEKLNLQQLILNLHEAENIVTHTTNEILDILVNEFGEKYYNHFQDDDFFSSPVRERKELHDPEALIEYFRNRTLEY